MMSLCPVAYLYFVAPNIACLCQRQSKSAGRKVHTNIGKNIVSVVHDINYATVFLQDIQ